MRLVCISDTHGRHKNIESLPDGDVLISAGDFTRGESRTDIRRFAAWMEKQPHKYKIIIAGNHERLFENRPDIAMAQLSYYPEVIYLQDTAIELDGVKFYGSPWQPEFFNWAFNLPRGQKLREKWEEIPKDTDVLITHGPPKNILDEAPAYNRPGEFFNCGCEELRDIVLNELDLKCHVFGHIHAGYGKHIEGGTTFINAAICDEDYRASNEPIIFDL